MNAQHRHALACCARLIESQGLSLDQQLLVAEAFNELAFDSVEAAQRLPTLAATAAAERAIGAVRDLLASPEALGVQRSRWLRALLALEALDGQPC